MCRQNQRRLGPSTLLMARTKPGSAGLQGVWAQGSRRAGRPLRRGQESKPRRQEARPVREGPPGTELISRKLMVVS